MYYLYIIYSNKLDRYYIGHTENIDKRIIEHNTGFSSYTSKALDWILVYKEQFTERIYASRREMELKRKKSRKYIEWMIQNK
jgi:putative endonuclease